MTYDLMCHWPLLYIPLETQTVRSPAKIKVKEGLGETECCGPGGELALAQGVVSCHQLSLAKHLTMDIEQASGMKGLDQLGFGVPCIGCSLWKTGQGQQPLGLESSERGQKSLRKQGLNLENSPADSISPPPSPTTSHLPTAHPQFLRGSSNP